MMASLLSVRHSLLCIAALLLSMLVALPPARAQFTGPPTGADLGTAAVPTTDQTALYPSIPEPLLEAGDDINVRLFGIDAYNFTGRIAFDGTVSLPLIGVTRLAGLSVTAAEELIARRLVEAGQYRDPQVTLTLAAGGTNATISFIGEMHSVVPVVGTRRLYSAMAAAGGLPNTASRTLTILRSGQKQPISVDLGNDPVHSAAANIPLFPGDTVVASRIGVVYVSGEFRTPGTVQITNYGPLTLSQVSAQVGGPVWDARYGALHIIRTVGDHRTVSTVNIKDVLFGKAPDPIMQPNDIVFLPPSPFKSSLVNGSIGSVLGILSVAIATIYSVR